MDIVCQAKSGMGKTAVFVLAVLQQLEPEPGVVDTLVLCHTRELAYQICQEFERFSKYFPDVKVAVLFGGISIREHRRMLKEDTPHIVVGTPGRTLALANEGALKLDKLKRFVMDECDSLLESLDMRKDVQAIFKHTPHEKQVSQRLFGVCVLQNSSPDKSTGDALLGDDIEGDASRVPSVCAAPVGDLRRRRVQADAARPAAALREAERVAEEQKVKPIA